MAGRPACGHAELGWERDRPSPAAVALVSGSSVVGPLGYIDPSKDLFPCLDLTQQVGPAQLRERKVSRALPLAPRAPSAQACGGHGQP